MIDQADRDDHCEGDSPSEEKLKDFCDICQNKGYYTMPGFEERWVNDPRFPMQVLRTIEVLKKIPCKCGRKYEETT